MKRPPLSTALALATAASSLALCLALPAGATDVGVSGSKLSVSTNTANGRQTLVSVQKGGDVHVGTPPGVNSFRATLEAYYVDAPTNQCSLPMPSPWFTISSKTAKYANRLAPTGPSGVKSAAIAYGKTARVTAKSTGGLDITLPPGPGGIVTVLSIENSGDSSFHRLCTLYSTANGSVIKHKVLPTGRKLTATRGVPTACPDCSDGWRNGSETDVDCGGPSPSCARCGTGDGCGVAGDCQSGVCAAGSCQAATCGDGVRNGAETDVDCGGPACADCGIGGSCSVGGD